MAAPGKSFSQKAWAFLNSAFGLWFLSTIAIGMVTWSFTEWQANQAQEREDQKRLRQLELEATARVRAIEALVTNAQSAKQFYEALALLDDPTFGNLPTGVFPEFRERSLRSLLWELKGLAAEEADIVGAIDAADQISHTFQQGIPKLESSQEFREERLPKEAIDELTSLLRSISYRINQAEHSRKGSPAN